MHIEVHTYVMLTHVSQSRLHKIPIPGFRCWDANCNGIKENQKEVKRKRNHFILFEKQKDNQPKSVFLNTSFVWVTYLIVNAAKTKHVRFWSDLLKWARFSILVFVAIVTHVLRNSHSSPQ